MTGFVPYRRGYHTSMWRLWVALVCLAIAAVLVVVLINGGLPYGGSSGGGSGAGDVPAGGGPALIGGGSLGGGQSAGGGVGVSASPSASGSPRSRGENTTGGITGGAFQPKGFAPLVMPSTRGLGEPANIIAPAPAQVATPATNITPPGVPVYAAPAVAPIGAGLQGSQTKATPVPTSLPKPSPSPVATATSAPAPQSSVFPTWTPYAASSATPH